MTTVYEKKRPDKYPTFMVRPEVLEINRAKTLEEFKSLMDKYEGIKVTRLEQDVIGRTHCSLTHKIDQEAIKSCILRQTRSLKKEPLVSEYEEDWGQWWDGIELSERTDLSKKISVRPVSFLKLTEREKEKLRSYALEEGII